VDLFGSHTPYALFKSFNGAPGLVALLTDKSSSSGYCYTFLKKICLTGIFEKIIGFQGKNEGTRGLKR
jgi:hypothetical protein